METELYCKCSSSVHVNDPRTFISLYRSLVDCVCWDCMGCLHFVDTKSSFEVRLATLTRRVRPSGPQTAAKVRGPGSIGHTRKDYHVWNCTKR